MPGKYLYTKAFEAAALRLRFEMHEGDARSPVPGAFYGAVILLDEHDNVVSRESLGPEDLADVVNALLGLKTQAVERSGAVFVEDAIDKALLNGASLEDPLNDSADHDREE